MFERVAGREKEVHAKVIMVLERSCVRKGCGWKCVYERDVACGLDVGCVCVCVCVKETYVEGVFVKGLCAAGIYVKELGVKEKCVTVRAWLVEKRDVPKLWKLILGKIMQNRVLAAWAVRPDRLCRPSWKWTVCNRCSVAVEGCFFARCVNGCRMHHSHNTWTYQGHVQLTADM